MRVLHAEGCRVLEKGRDGAGHQTVTFQANAQTIKFHFPNTGKMNGHTRRNVTARLRRMIREVPPLPEQPEPVEAPQEAVEQLVVPITPPTPPIASKRLTRDRRREIAKRYLALGSIEQTSEEFDLPETKLITVLMADSGEARRRVKIELNVRKAEAAKRLRLTTLPKAERDKRIAKLYFSAGMTAKKVGAMFGIAASTVVRIARR